MAPDKKEKKRKASVASDPPAKKTKKVEPTAAETPKTVTSKPISKKKTVTKAKDTKDIKDTQSVPSVKANTPAARQPKPRKRAADLISDDENDESAPPTSKTQKKPTNKKSKKEEAVSAVKKAGKAAPKVVDGADESDDENIEDESADASSSDEAEDDQTVALIKGFESSGEENEEESGDEGFNNSKPIPKIPKKIARKLAKSETADSPKEPGTVYVGRIPHGFYEHQMRAYFSQFGDITNLRLSRNRTTGSSKHYAFVEFSSIHVAKIVAATMDNYLMYGHILKCKFVPKEQLHPEIWKGANRRFKKTPWNRIEKKRLEKPKTREQWSKSIEKEQTKREAKADKLKALGYQLPLPQLKSADDVPVQEEKAIETAPVEEPVKAVEEAPSTKEEAPKQVKKNNKKADKAEKNKVEKVKKIEQPKKVEQEPKKEAAATKKKSGKKSKA
ncbi:hypothetical protein N7495_000606 [Penicillium taxi]|uniref:uncharacterized protein n=1 Tax=Penicillium taxi TaxID=168475 RepID=UPI00254516A8|nr:uncharacterized protein N7495_000606 [Penicillium taxi]KAJ5907924.1 hypothetical protein N7495_000606 [Penicillium taxi]